MKHNITVVISLMFCVAATAQFNEAAKTQIIKEWQRAKVYTLEYLDAMPKDKYDFKATIIFEKPGRPEDHPPVNH